MKISKGNISVTYSVEDLDEDEIILKISKEAENRIYINIHDNLDDVITVLKTIQIIRGSANVL